MSGGWGPEDGAGYIPTEEGGSGRDLSGHCPLCGKDGEQIEGKESTIRACTNVRCRINEFIIA